MKATQALRFRRLSKPDEDGLIRIEVRAQNETITVTGDSLTSAKSLVTFAENLDTFPMQLPASVSFSAAGGSCDVAIALETLDGSGHVGIRVSIQDDSIPQRNSATLWLKSEPNALMGLARQLRTMAELSSETAELST